MQISRKELIKAFATCKPAIASQNRAVELSHYWLDGETLSAYNGNMIISTPTDLDVIGGVPDTVLDWLKKVDGETVNLSSVDGKLSISSGKSKGNFALLDLSRRIYTPEIDLDDLGLPPITLNASLIEALDNVSVSQDSKATAPAKLGVFLYPRQDNLDLYATDDYTITKQTVPLQDTISDSLLFLNHIVIPFSFVEQIIEYKDSSGACVYLSDRMAILYAEPVTIISGLIECSAMPKFDEIIESFEAPTIPVPEDLTEALDRLSQIPGPIEMIINNNILHLACESQGSRAEEQFPLVGSHTGGIMVKLDPRLLKRVAKGRSYLGIKSKGLYLTGPEQYTHIMAGVK